MKKHIDLLVIEEEKNEQVMFQRFFDESNLRYYYTFSNSVKDALKKLKINKYHAIISNINFVDGHVFDILPHIKRTPFIIITARGYEEIAVMALKRGASDYIVRDVERHYLEILPKAIKKAIVQRRNDKIIGIFTGAFECMNNYVSVFDTDGFLLFANKAFRKQHKLRSDYFLKNIHTIFKQYQVTGEPEFKTFFADKIKKESRYTLCTLATGPCGSISLIPVADQGKEIMGYVLLEDYNENVK